MQQEWSILDYFNSWKDSQTSLNSTTTSKECEDLPTPSWDRRRQGRVNADGSNVCQQHARNHQVSNNSNEVSFLQEIKPCLVSMFHMEILLWAPIVLVFCLKKLYVPCKEPCSCFCFRRLYIPCKAPVHEREPASSGLERTSIQKPSYFIAIPAMPTMPSLPSLPSLPKARLSNDKQRGHAPEPNQSNSFERLLMMMSLFLNAISMMASFSAIFSIEEKKDEEAKPNSSESGPRQSVNENRSAKYKHSSSSCSEDNMLRQGPFIFTSEWLAYVVALVITSILMNDAMYVLAFPQSNLVALHMFVISISMKRFGSKRALLTALPISAIAFLVMAHQDLDLPTIQPGLYYDETNSFISGVVKEWPIEKRTYDDGRGTPWMMTGDVRTGLPFIVNEIPKQKFVRRLVVCRVML